MKIKTFLALSAFAMLFFSCNKSSTQGSAIITGKVKVNWSDKVNLRHGTVSLAEDWSNTTDDRDSVIALDNGTFKIKLNIDGPRFYSLSHEQNKIELYIAPGDSLHITMGEEIKFSGTNAAINKHLKSQGDIIKAQQNYIVRNESTFFSQSPSDFNARLDSMRSVYLDNHEQFKNKNEVSDRYEQRIQADIAFKTKFYKLVHPSLYDLYTNQKLDVTPTYYEDLAEGSFNDPALLKAANYTLFLDRYVEIQAAGDHKYGNYFDVSIEKIHSRYKAIKALNAHQDIKDYLFTEHLKKSIANYGITYLEDLMSEFQQDCKDSTAKKQFETLYNENVERRKKPTEIKVYKKVGPLELEAHIFYPEDYKEGEQRPAYLFFHGGGWSMGIPEWGYKNCKRYSATGMVAISFEYRLVDIHETYVTASIKDAKSAVLWARKQARSLGIDPNRIVAAGGHLAACTAILDDYEETDNMGLSSKPNAIIVHSATYNTLKQDWFSKQSDGKPESISTFHQLKKNLVPSIFFHGTADHLAPISEFTEFRDKMEALGNNFEYKIFENVGHFFGNPKAREEVNQMTKDFLVKLGYISE